LLQKKKKRKEQKRKEKFRTYSSHSKGGKAYFSKPPNSFPTPLTLM
jgi:hypothetical protein